MKRSSDGWLSLRRRNSPPVGQSQWFPAVRDSGAFSTKHLQHYLRGKPQRRFPYLGFSTFNYDLLRKLIKRTNVPTTICENRKKTFLLQGRFGPRVLWRPCESLFIAWHDFCFTFNPTNKLISTQICFYHCKDDVYTQGKYIYIFIKKSMV